MTAEGARCVKVLATRPVGVSQLLDDACGFGLVRPCPHGHLDCSPIHWSQGRPPGTSRLRKTGIARQRFCSSAGQTLKERRPEVWGHCSTRMSGFDRARHRHSFDQDGRPISVTLLLDPAAGSRPASLFGSPIREAWAVPVQTFADRDDCWRRVGCRPVIAYPTFPAECIRDWLFSSGVTSCTKRPVELRSGEPMCTVSPSPALQQY